MYNYSIKETCLYVSDLKRTEQFYSQILKFPVISFVPDRHVFFRVGKDVLLCFNPKATEKEKNLPPHFAYGKQHIAFEVPIEEYFLLKDKLQKDGIEITHTQSWKQDKESFYFNDPDGHVLEIVQPGIWG